MNHFFRVFYSILPIKPGEGRTFLIFEFFGFLRHPSVTVHKYTQLRAELTAVVLADSTPLVVVGQVVLTPCLSPLKCDDTQTD